MKNLNIVGGVIKNPCASMHTSATQIVKNNLQLSQTQDSIYSDEPVTPFHDFMMDDYNPFQRDPETVHTEESSSSSDVANTINADKTA